MKQQHASIPTINQQITDLINTVTTKPNISHQSQENSLSEKPENREVKKRTAEYIYRILERETSILRNRINTYMSTKDKEEYDRIQSILEAIDKGDESLLQEYGINFEYAWCKDVMATLIDGKFPFEIQTIAITASAQYDSGTEKFHFNPFLFRTEDLIGFELARLFKKLGAVTQTMRQVIDINEFIDPKSNLLLTSQESDQYVLATLSLLEQSGIVNPDEVAGRDYHLMRESNKAKQINVLITQLRFSQNGDILIDDDGNIYYKPSGKLLEKISLNSKARYREFESQGILLKHANGIPTKAALFASGFLDPLNKYIYNLLILDKKSMLEQDKVYTLLRAIDMVRAERYHNIYFDSTNLSPDLATYAIGKILQLHTKNLLNTLVFYNEWPDFDSYEYVERNYDNNGEILPDDKQIITSMIQGLKQLGIEPHSLENVADVGTGPNLYPAMLLSPYVKNDTKLELLEFSPNRAYLAKVIGGTIEQKHAKIWRKFEEFMVSVGGDLYKESEESAKKNSKIQYGNIFTLPKGRYDLLTSHSCAESIVDSQLPFRVAIQSLGRALKPNGLLMVAHVVESEGWPAGEGTHFPAVKLTVKQIKQAYLDANLDIISVMSVGHAEKTFREGYHGLALIIAQQTQDKFLEDSPLTKKEDTVEKKSKS